MDPRATPPVQVLVVDDHDDTREALTELFAQEGLSVVALGGAVEAWAFLQSGARPAIILLDLEMPDLSGWGFCTRLVADPATANIPVAIITATPAYRGVPARRVDAGVFRKPLDVDELLARVREFVASAPEQSKAEATARLEDGTETPAPEDGAELSKTIG